MLNSDSRLSCESKPSRHGGFPKSTRPNKVADGETNGTNLVEEQPKYLDSIPTFKDGNIKSKVIK